MIFWIVAGIVTALCVVLLIRPFARRDGAEEDERRAGSLDIYRDQLAELDQDLEAGLLSEGEAASARREIERRMLAADRRAGPAPGSRASHGKALAVAILVVFPIMAVGLYAWLGEPGLPSLPYAEREEERAAAGGVMARVQELLRRTEENPGDAAAWLELAALRAQIDRFGPAAEAYRAALEAGADPRYNAALGEMITLASGGTVTPGALEAFEKTLAADPGNPRARYYVALALSQEGRLRAALDAWMALAADSPADAPWRPTLERAIRTIAAEMGQDPEALEIPVAEGLGGPQPSQEEVEAIQAMTPEEREAFIRSMVEALAARLEEDPENPDNFDAWLRLAQSYVVLGEEEKAREALARAEAIAAALPRDDPRRRAFEQPGEAPANDEGAQ